MIENKVLQMARRAMLENIDSLDIETLRKELKVHLEKEFVLIDEAKEKRESFVSYLDKITLDMEETPADNLDQLIQKLSCLTVVDIIREEFNKIYFE